MSVSTSNKDIPKQTRENLHAMLLSSISHDLKTPLACIIGSLDIYQQLKDTLSEERKTSLISSAIMEARRLDSFITNILDMAKLESDISFKHECVDIGQLVRQCILKMEPVLCQHKVRLELPSKIIMADINELWITRALALLLDNAALYTSINTDIVVTVTKDNLACWIAVRDYGPGIPKKLLPTLFHKHSRAVYKDTKTAGTGLGLPICKAIAQKHGGTIWCDKPGSGDGTVFTITLPLSQKKIKGEAGELGKREIKN
jgi:two-component system, OmpR family, sensor histidine kinase KdpD